MGRRLFRDLSFAFFFSMLAAILSYVIRFVLTRRLTVEQYGLFYAVFSFIGLFALFKNLGTISAIMKLLPEYKVKNEISNIKQTIISVFTLNFLVSLVLGTFLILFSSKLSEFYFGEFNSVKIIYLLVGFFIFSTLVEVIAASFLGLGQNIFYVLRELLVNGLVLLFVVFYPLFDVTTPAMGYFLATIVVFVIYAFIFVLKNKKILFLKVKFKSDIALKLVKFGAPMLLILAGARLLQFLDTAVLTYYRSLTEVGIYNVALPIAMLLIVLVGEIGSILSPLVSELKARGNNNALKVGFELIQKYGLYLSVPIAIVFFFYSQEIISLLFGIDYISGANSLKILMVGSIFYIVYKLNVVGVSFIGKPGVITKIVLVTALFDLILNLLLIPKYGIEGAASATALSFFLAFLLSTIATKKYLDVKYPIKELTLILVLGFVTLFLIKGLQFVIPFNTFIEGVVVLSIAALFYLFGGVLFKIVNIKELKLLLRR